MWFKNIKVFRLNPNWTITAEELEQVLQVRAFAKGNASEGTNLGWVSPLKDNGLVYPVGKCLFITLQAETKLLPASVIKQFVDEKASEIEEQQGYKPGRKQLKEIKEMVTDTLLPRAFSVFRQTRVCLDLENHWLYIDAGTASKTDEVISLLVKALNPMPIELFMTELSPTTAMTEWTINGEVNGFSLEPISEIISTQEDGAKINYSNVNPSPEEANKHAERGRVVTKLGLTWRDRISFVLNNDSTIKRIEPLEILSEKRNPNDADETERFEADMTLMCAEFNGLLSDLVESLGGFKHVS